MASMRMSRRPSTQTAGRVPLSMSRLTADSVIESISAADAVPVYPVVLIGLRGMYLDQYIA